MNDETGGSTVSGYFDKINKAFGITPEDIPKFDRKIHSRTAPESKRVKRKAAHESRRRNFR